MKRLISLLITSSVLLSSVSAFAELKPTVENGNIAGVDVRENWLKTMQSDYRVHEIIDGNVAFVHNSDRAWNKNEIVTMEKKAQYNSDTKEFSLPTEVVNNIFGLTESTANGMVTSARVASLTGKNVFIDPRGLVLFSDNANAVNTSVPDGWSHYYDYFSVVDVIAYITWEDQEFTEDERKAYIENWKSMLTIPSDLNASDYSTYVSATLKTTRSEAEKITKRSDGTYDIDGLTFDDYVLEGASLLEFKENVYTAITKLLNIALGYSLLDQNSTEAKKYRELILECMDYVMGYYEQGWNYSEDSKQNWMYSQVYIPISYSNLLCLMYDHMTDAKRLEHTNIVFDKSPIPNVRTAGIQNNVETLTNLLWRSFGYFNTAVMANDTERMNYAMKYTTPAYLYSARNLGFDELTFQKDGFYEDGSMIFHNHHPYSNGYGLSYTILVNEMLGLTAGSKFDMRNVYGFENIYSVCENNILPFLEEGLLMKMTLGRNTVIADISQIRNCAYISNYAPEPYRKSLVTKIKQVLGDRTLSAGSRSYFVSEPAKSKMLKEFEDYCSKNVSATEETEESSTVYYNQDQVIHRTNDFTVALSMSSSRIHKYESFPPSNSTGWYLGDGMLYVYTDGKQYDQGYFNNADPYYMPGTTVDSTVRQEIHTGTAPGWGLPDNDWAGGVTDGKNTVAGYVLGNEHVSKLEGKKSYFMFGDKIVCIGSGIKGDSGNVYTVVDNRFINKPSDVIKPIETGYDVAEITFSNEDNEPDIPNTIDGNPNSSCALANIGDWLCFDLGEKRNIGYVGMAFLYGDARQELATIMVSDDGENFTVLKEFESTGESKDIELYEMNCSARYFKIVSKGNSRGNAWFNLAEIVFYKDTATMEEIEKSKNIISSGYDTLIVDSKEQEPVFNTATPIENPGWVWLENHEGLVFLQDSKLNVERRRKPSSPTFMHISIEHGEKPEGAGYAYVMLPLATAEETKAFAENNQLKIIENSTKMHAVSDEETGLIGANIFAKGVTLEGITFNTPCSVLINKTAGKIYVSDPTWKQKLIKLTMPENVQSAAGIGITVKKNELTVDSSIRMGSTHEINCKFAGESDESGSLKVMNYHLKASDHYISTTLWAGNAEGNVSFEIKTAPGAGRAIIEGNKLYYYSSGSITKDTMTIRAKDSTGAYADFAVTITE